MKQIILAALFMIPTISFGAVQPVTCESSAVAEPEAQKLLNEACTNDWFAGALVTVDILGKSYQVDRRAEPPKPTGDSAGAMEKLGDIVSGMQNKSSGEITGEFKWSQYPNGTLREGYIKITAKGSWQVGKEPNAPLPISKEDNGQ